MKKTQTKTDKKAGGVIVELSEKELASVAGGAKKERRVIVYSTTS